MWLSIQRAWQEKETHLKLRLHTAGYLEHKFDIRAFQNETHGMHSNSERRFLPAISLRTRELPSKPLGFRLCISL